MEKFFSASKYKFANFLLIETLPCFDNCKRLEANIRLLIFINNVKSDLIFFLSESIEKIQSLKINSKCISGMIMEHI